MSLPAGKSCIDLHFSALRKHSLSSWKTSTAYHPTKGSCQVQKNPKIREKLGLSRQHPPNRLSVFYIFFGNMYNEKNNTKNTIFQKKRNPSWGLTHPPTSEFFLTYWIFFNLTKLLRTIHLYNNFIMLDQRRRRWIDAVQLLYKCSVFAGIAAVILSSYSRVFQLQIL